MRVLTVVGDLGMGGTQRVAQNLTLGVQARGHAVAVLAHEALGVRAELLREAGVPLFGPVAAGDSPPADDPALVAARAWGAEIIHIHRTGYPNPRETALLAALRTEGGRVVETNVFARYDGGPARHLIDVHAQLTRWCLMKWTLWRRGRGRDAVGVVLPNSVDPDRFTPLSAQERAAARADLSLPAGAFLFGRIGQPSPSKWDPAIFDVFAQVAVHEPRAWLLLVGAPDGYRAQADALPPSIANRIVFRDPVADDAQLRGWFGAMDAFLHMALIGESFGMVLCEAMLCDTPVLTLATPLKDNSQMEVVGHEEGGLVALDQVAMVGVMRRILDDGELRSRLRARARERVIEQFAIPIVAARAEAIYSALLAATDRAELRGLLTTLDGPAPDARWRRTMLRRADGRVPVRQRAGFGLVHSPGVYNAYLALRRLRGG